MKYRISPLLFLLFLSFQTGNTEDWPMYGHNPRLTWSGSCPVSANLEVKWKFSLPDDISHELEWMNTPVVVDNKVYFANPEGIYCLDGDTGDIVFTWDYALRPSRPLVVQGTRLYIGGMCLDMNTGGIIWETDLGIISSIPLIYDEKVYFLSLSGADSIFDIRPPPEGLNMNTITCLNAETGETIWRFTLPREEVGNVKIFSHVFTAPVIDGGRIYFAVSRDNLNRSIYCRNAETGEEIWVKEIEESENGFVQYVGQHLLASNGDLICRISQYICCLNGETGEIKWRYPLPEGTVGEATMAVQEGVLAVRGADVVCAVDVRNGFSLWETSVPGMETDIAIADGKVLVGSKDGNLYMLGAETGEIIARYDLGEDVYSPIVASGKVFITSRKTLYVLGEKENYGFLLFTGLIILLFLALKYLQDRGHTNLA